jgi:hypothetical protein
MYGSRLSSRTECPRSSVGTRRGRHRGSCGSWRRHSPPSGSSGQEIRLYRRLSSLRRRRLRAYRTVLGVSSWIAPVHMSRPSGTSALYDDIMALTNCNRLTSIPQIPMYNSLQNHLSLCAPPSYVRTGRSSMHSAPSGQWAAAAAYSSLPH